MLHTPFYDPSITYDDNYEKGPFGAFADKEVFKQTGEPQNKFLGIPVFLPFGIAAGPLVNGKFVNAALDKGFDIAVYKTVRTANHPCNLWPNVVSLNVKDDLTLDMQDKGITVKKKFTSPLTITNSFGVPSKNPDVWQKDMSSAVKYAKKGQVVVGSFQGTTKPGKKAKNYINDFVIAARMVKQTGAKILEVNLSCPNEGSSHLLCFDIARSREVISSIKEEIGNTPLIIKIAYYREQDQLKNLISELGGMVQGISTINTMPAKIFNEKGKQALPGDNRLISGTCGAGVKWAGLEMVERLRKLREEFGLKFEIIGVGGVTTPKDYFEYRAAGADAVMSATGAMWNPFLAQEIKELT